ncbi:MAG: polyribonucleotide nucleotidyltransferase [Candidatus Stahlbacteria bacterium]|nr:polyribonucleotide nucleotidyltransferase [Candidatus Stahlbacteria bacterium]
MPGGFFKREGRPTDKEILTSRLIDRSIRPLFPDGWQSPVQVIASILSSDIENDGDILGLLGASVALRMSSIPFQYPIGAVRIGFTNNQFILNPTTSELEDSSLNLVVVGSKAGITMIEANCKEVKEETIIDAIKFALPDIHKLIELQEDIEVKTQTLNLKPQNSELKSMIVSKFGPDIELALKITDRLARGKKLQEIQGSLIENIGEQYEVPNIISEFESLERDIVRRMVTEQKLRVDGRGIEELRPITCEISVLPRVHGAAIFTKGETQSLCTVTLGTVADEQKIDPFTGETYYKSFLVHYNFPPFSVGEVRGLRSPGRREVGHGTLAEKSLEPIIPVAESFPYTIRLVSDILSSNGSSSMATVCSGSLALMDAGIPIKSHIAGVGLGLIDDVVLVDAVGEEDHFGDMDFKIAGTKDGLTAIQLDIKTKGLSLELVEKSLLLGREARFKVLEHLNAAIPVPKKEISDYAPKLTVLLIPKEKIGQVIGPGGKVIREIIEKTGAKVEISDDGKVTISSDSWSTTETAKKIVEGIVEEVQVGKTYLGKVTRILPFGAIVEILPGKEGLLHISQLANYRVQNTEDEVKLGEEVPVKVLAVEENGKIQLSRKAVLH